MRIGLLILSVLLAANLGADGHQELTLGVSVSTDMARSTDRQQLKSGNLPGSLSEKPDLGSPDFGNPDLGNPDFGSPDFGSPDFGGMVDVETKKQAFYDFLLPLIRNANHEVTAQRMLLTDIRDLLLRGDAPGKDDLQVIGALAGRYGVNAELVAPRLVGELLRRVDVVPASLVLAQAAKESGWGTSRFATAGNNFFGIWCFKAGCGLTPLRRSDDQSHEVAVFDNVYQGVRFYIRTLNTNRAYIDLRAIRAEARRNNAAFVGEQLAMGLTRYSERGAEYVKEIQVMIRYNRLGRFTRVSGLADSV